MRTPPSTKVVMLRCAHRSLIVEHRRPGTPAKSQLLLHVAKATHAPHVSSLQRVRGGIVCHPARPIRWWFFYSNFADFQQLAIDKKLNPNRRENHLIKFCEDNRPNTQL